jgi:hypothetical protein
MVMVLGGRRVMEDEVEPADESVLAVEVIRAGEVVIMRKEAKPRP